MMMDMELFGRKIAASRQNRGWTQRQLARQLSVSHQAVSKWEQGAAVPDLETLIAMARLFGVSLDELTSTDPVPPVNFSREMDEDFDEEEDEFEEEEEETEEEDEEDEDEHEHAHEVHVHADESDEYSFEYDYDEDHGFESVTIKSKDKKADPKLKLLMQIAPFVDREILDEKFREYLQNHEVGSYKHITALAPFVSREVISEALLQVVNDELDSKMLMSLMPFISKKDRMILIDKMEDKEWMLENIGSIAPFLPKEYLGKLINQIEF
ncbi:MAG: helix-turn-helix transcriptional regulator [Anaerolineae bacterium]|jgi:transcriptional regulator with XRE-family HTH domain|nr:helix-turn-helix transcriptional regulator [Anaerolineae bacterium]